MRHLDVWAGAYTRPELAGGPEVRADVGIRGDQIAAIGDLSGESAAQVIDARGKVVTPGFIEMHSHADQTLLGYPTMDSMLHQGITTFVGCMCGQSIALESLDLQPLYEHLQYIHLEELNTVFEEYVSTLDSTEIHSTVTLNYLQMETLMTAMKLIRDVGG